MSPFSVTGAPSPKHDEAMKCHDPRRRGATLLAGVACVGSVRVARNLSVRLALFV
jgi:hypothetical protein